MHIPIATPPPSTTTGYYIYLAINMCIRTAIPIFFMISGAVLLHKVEEHSVVIKKRIFHFFIILASAIALQILFGSYIINKQNFLNHLFGYTINYVKHQNLPYGMPTQWYLYAYLALLIMLPIVRPAAQGMSNKSHLYLITAYIITVFIIPTALFFINAPYHHRIHNHLPFYSTEEWLPNAGMNWLFYALLGYYLEHRIKNNQLTSKKIMLLIGLAIICTFASCFMMEAVRIKQEAHQIKDFFFATKFTVIPAIALYLTVRYMTMRVTFSKRTSSLIHHLGRAVIIVFLFENILRRYSGIPLAKISDLLPSSGYFEVYILNCLHILIVVSAGLIGGIILQYVPGIKRFI